MSVYRLLILLLCSGTCTSLFSQEVKKSTGRFHLNNLENLEAVELPDTVPPEIKLIEPGIGATHKFTTEKEQLDIIGEVTDAGTIRFVSINREVMMVSESGVFVTQLKLTPGMNEVSINAMDEDYNRQSVDFTVEYTPPVITLADKIRQESRYFALLIGIDEYEDPDMTDLDNPVNDAQQLHNTLISKYNFREEDVVVLKNPERSDIIEELDILRGKITANDNFLIFYAGHGYYDENAEIGYWLPSDATLESTANWFPNSTLVNHLRGIRSKHTLLITDACFAGSIFKTRSVDLPQEMVYERIYEQPSRKAMTSGTLIEVPDNSMFIKYLLQRLDENSKQYLSAEELFSSMRNAVISNSNVLPRFGEIQNVGNEGGDFIFLRNE